jgi:hypothetical protein
MEWIYKCHIICVEHIQRFELLPIDNETCTIRVKVSRKLRNVSDNAEPAELGIAIDEWFHKTGSSRIIACGYIKEGVSWSQNGENVKINKKENTISMEKKKIRLAPSEEIDTWYEAEEVKRTNDVQSWNFVYPTLNPMVCVKSYEGLDFRVSFGYRISSEQLGDDTYRLPGTLLPGQVLAVQWWRVEDVNRWLGTPKKPKS